MITQAHTSQNDIYYIFILLYIYTFIQFTEKGSKTCERCKFYISQMYYFLELHILKVFDLIELL